MRWIQPPESLPANWFPRAIVSGFFASLVALIAFVNLYGVAWLFAKVDFIPNQGGNTVTTWFNAILENQIISLARANLAIATAIHMVTGVLFAMVYAYFFRERFIGPSWRRGALFSLIPWAISIGIFMPILGGGLFGLSLAAGPLVILGSLILHLVYGITLGLTYISVGRGALEERGMSAIDQHAQYKSQRTSALGIVLGTLLGSLIGSVLAIVPQALPNLSLGVDPWFLALGAALIGGAWGGLAGSMWGLPLLQEEEAELAHETGGMAPVDERWMDTPRTLQRVAAPVSFQWNGSVSVEDWQAFHDQVLAKLPPSARLVVNVDVNAALPASAAEARIREVRRALRNLGLHDRVNREAA